MPIRPCRPSASLLNTVWLPIATPCSFSPCSKPHSQNGREPITRAVSPACGISMYWQRRRVPGAWRCAGELHERLALGGRAVAVLGEQHGAVGGGAAERDQRIAGDAHAAVLHSGHHGFLQRMRA